jgi:hypothetical protein
METNPAQPKTFEDLWRTAVHEAGHAVYAYHFCIPTLEVWIDPNQDPEAEVDGRVSCEHSLVPGSSRVLTGLCYAGRVAEFLFFGTCPDGSDQDLRDMLDVNGLTYEPDENGSDPCLLMLAESAGPLVRGILTRRQPAVLRLARALVKKNRLTGAEVLKIIHRHRNRRDRSRVPRSLWHQATRNAPERNRSPGLQETAKPPIASGTYRR